MRTIISIVEGRNGTEPILDMRMLLIMERLKMAFWSNLEREAQFLGCDDPLTAMFGFVFRDKKEVFFEFGKYITPETARINWESTKGSKFALHAKLVLENNVYCDLYFGEIFCVDEHENVDSLKKIIESAGVTGINYLE